MLGLCHVILALKWKGGVHTVVLPRISCFDICLKDSNRDNDLPFLFWINVESLDRYPSKSSLTAVLLLILVLVLMLNMLLLELELELKLNALFELI